MNARFLNAEAINACLHRILIGSGCLSMCVRGECACNFRVNTNIILGYCWQILLKLPKKSALNPSTTDFENIWNTCCTHGSTSVSSRSAISFEKCEKCCRTLIKRLKLKTTVGFKDASSPSPKEGPWGGQWTCLCWFCLRFWDAMPF